MTPVHRLAQRLVLTGALSVAAVVPGLVGATPGHASGSTRYVSVSGGSDVNGADPNGCTSAALPCATIQHAVDEADAGDTVSVGPGTYHESVIVGKSLTMIGAGAGGSSGTTVDGDSDGAPLVFVNGDDAAAAPDVLLRAMSLSDGFGFGLRVRSAHATLQDSVVTANAYSGVLVENAQAGAAISRVSISDNGAGAHDAGLTVDGGILAVDNSAVSQNARGGIVLEDAATAAVSTSTVDGNVAAGIVAEAGSHLSLRASTVSHTVPSSGGGGSTFGGGLLVFDSHALVDNSTLDSNAGQGVLSQSGDVTIARSTITGTKPDGTAATDGGPIGALAVTNSQPGAATRVTASILAASRSVPACAGPVVDGGYNLATDHSCTFTKSTSRNARAAHLHDLAYNGGPTKTARPALSSYAVDAIPHGKANCVAHATDQRGVSRPQGTRCDIGAVEVKQKRLVIRPISLPHGRRGVHYSVALHASGGRGAPYAWTLSAGRLPHGVHLRHAGRITGTPTESGTFHITVSVDHAAHRHYSLVIKPKAH